MRLKGVNDDRSNDTVRRARDGYRPSRGTGAGRPLSTRANASRPPRSARTVERQLHVPLQNVVRSIREPLAALAFATRASARPPVGCRTLLTATARTGPDEETKRQLPPAAAACIPRPGRRPLRAAARTYMLFISCPAWGSAGSAGLAAGLGAGFGAAVVGLEAADFAISAGAGLDLACSADFAPDASIAL